MKRSRLILLTCLVLASGCVTDELAVFEGNVLTDEEMKPFIGKYEVVAITGDYGQQLPKEHFKGFSLEVTKKDTAYHFDYQRGESSSGTFVLSRIPDQKAGLMVFASPKVKSTGHSEVLENVFFIVKRDKDTIRLWWTLGDEPVARDFSFTQKVSKDGFKVTEIKEFLTKHADDFVAKNPARITFKKTD